MLALVIGGSGSGKSEYAENLAVALNHTKLIYIATMMPLDDESFKRIERHHDLRNGKGFQTIECYTNIKDLEIEDKPTILLECMSNLVANELYSENRMKHRENVASICDDILAGINYLIQKSSNVIIVTNDVFSDGNLYDDETAHYIEILGAINGRIGLISNKIVEVVCGIPINIRTMNEGSKIWNYM